MDAAGDDLSVDDVCHLDVSAAIWLAVPRDSHDLQQYPLGNFPYFPHQGRLRVTSSGLTFRNDFSRAMGWARVASATHVSPRKLYLETTSRWDSAYYEVDDAEYVAAIIDSAARLARPRRERALADVRAGTLPRAKLTKNYLLDLDEICYLEVEAEHIRDSSRSDTDLAGALLVTSRRIRFLTDERGWEIAWPRVMAVQHTAPDRLHIQATQRAGGGYYEVDDAEYAAAVIDASARVSRRELLMTDNVRQSRQIPHDIKQRVWQRDRGCCVECGSVENLEFDHVIPRSRGGADSENNLQLLCRSCNLKKGNRL